MSDLTKYIELVKRLRSEKPGGGLFELIAGSLEAADAIEELLAMVEGKPANEEYDDEKRKRCN